MFDRCDVFLMDVCRRWGYRCDVIFLMDVYAVEGGATGVM